MRTQLGVPPLLPWGGRKGEGTLIHGCWDSRPGAAMSHSHLQQSIERALPK